MSSGLDPFVSSPLETQPPFALETGEEGVPLMDGGGEVRVARVDQSPCTLSPKPAVAIRKLLNAAWVEAPAHRRCTVSPGIDQESLQHAAERTVAGCYLDHFAHAARPQVIEVPSNQPSLAFQHGTRTQLPMARLAGCLLEQPRERTRIVLRLQSITVRDIG